jgi:NAD(P)-dependent dehydrogenase (short-subunit alcohol dehydrogenase family)
MNPPNKHAGKIALITGGSSGIGLATAKRLIHEGARVFITGRRQTELDAAVREIGGDLTAVRSDIADRNDLDALFARIRQQAGRIDILFANAGGGSFLPLGAITEAHYDQIFDINVKGTLFTVQGALELMPAGASIILNGSITSIKGLPAFSVYSASKAAVRSFARTWAVDLKGRGIRINVVSPGTIITPAYTTQLGFNDDQIAAFAAQAADHTPLGRTGSADEIAQAVSFLASSESSFITGIELFVDGGFAQI